MGVDNQAHGVIRSRPVARHRYTITTEGDRGFRILETGDHPMLLMYSGGADLMSMDALSRAEAKAILQDARSGEMPGYQIRRDM